MSWLISFFASSIGRKLIMSLTGLFLITFLIVHLIGNLQLLYDDGGQAFNTYAYFMTHNPIIKTVSWGLYALILLHAIQGVLLALYNRKAKGTKYAVNNYENVSWASKNMTLLGILVFAFLLLHMGDFWWKMKFTEELDMVTYAGFDHSIKDLFTRVSLAFEELWIVIAYMIGLLALAFHLFHGFDSAFQTLGLRHKKYTPLISAVGKTYSILIPIGFAIIPLYIYFTK
ncbi:MAG: succinate dehydrogenase cytochrome b subunit [Saprospiraceae bacterium]